MFTSKQYRAKAAEYHERANKTDSANEIREYTNLHRTFAEMADNEEWVEQNYDKLMHPRPEQVDETRRAPAGTNPSV